MSFHTSGNDSLEVWANKNSETLLRVGYPVAIFLLCCLCCGPKDDDDNPPIPFDGEYSDDLNHSDIE